jgi:TPR repeat protein
LIGNDSYSPQLQEDFLRACDQGDFLACDKAGFAYYHMATNAQIDKKDSSLINLYAPSIEYLFNKACQEKVADGCAHLGDYKALIGNDSEGAILSKEACDMGSAAGCAGLYTYTMGSSAVELDDDKAIFYFKRACELGDKDACKIAANYQAYKARGK